MGEPIKGLGRNRGRGHPDFVVHLHSNADMRTTRAGARYARLHGNIHPLRAEEPLPRDASAIGYVRQDAQWPQPIVVDFFLV